MNKTLRVLLIGAVITAAVLGGAGPAGADTDCSTCTNQQDGDNENSSGQKGTAKSGSGVGGQVAGIVSSGDASVDATNRSEKVDAETGGAFANNTASAYVGLNTADNTTVDASDATASTVTNQQDGDNELGFDQAADASSGDGVGGQVIGVVTSVSGGADVVADNASKKIDTESGEADASNDSAAFVGLNSNPPGNLFVTADVDASSVTNQQDGDNTLEGDQAAEADTGDGVGGEVVGVVAGGDTSVDAKNRSEKIDLETGDATADNSSSAYVGLNTSDNTTVDADDAFASTATNQQEGDNEGGVSQSADAITGDAVGGQVAGLVTTAGGSADAVLDNASKKIDAESGEAQFGNDNSIFVGLNFDDVNLFVD